jgi:hypothetical protein
MTWAAGARAAAARAKRVQRATARRSSARPTSSTARSPRRLAARDTAGVHPAVTPLRLLDVIVRMRHRAGHGRRGCPGLPWPTTADRRWPGAQRPACGQPERWCPLLCDARSGARPGQVLTAALGSAQRPGNLRAAGDQAAHGSGGMRRTPPPHVMRCGTQSSEACAYVACSPLGHSCDQVRDLLTQFLIPDVILRRPPMSVFGQPLPRKRWT